MDVHLLFAEVSHSPSSFRYSTHAYIRALSVCRARACVRTCVGAHVRGRCACAADDRASVPPSDVPAGSCAFDPLARALAANDVPCVGRRSRGVCGCHVRARIAWIRAVQRSMSYATVSARTRPQTHVHTQDPACLFRVAKATRASCHYGLDSSAIFRGSVQRIGIFHHGGNFSSSARHRRNEFRRGHVQLRRESDRANRKVASFRGGKTCARKRATSTPRSTVLVILDLRNPRLRNGNSFI